MRATLLPDGTTWLYVDGENGVVHVSLNEVGMRVERTCKDSSGKERHHVTQAEWKDILPKAEGQLDLFKR